MRLREKLEGLSGIFVCASALALFIVGPVQAQSITLDVQGSLEASCALSGLPSGNVSLGDLSGAGSHTITFAVDCNAPFAYALVSGNGALGRVGGAAPVANGSQAFAASLPYTVTTSFNTDVGTFGDTNLAASTLTSANAAPCVAATYSATCPFTNSGTGAAAAGLSASLSIAWLPSSTQLQAGTYQDTLTLTVRART